MEWEQNLYKTNDILLTFFNLDTHFLHNILT
jgi:hypothetical protein